MAVSDHRPVWVNILWLIPDSNRHLERRIPPTPADGLNSHLSRLVVAAEDSFIKFINAVDALYSFV